MDLSILKLIASCDGCHAWSRRRLLNLEHLVVLLAGPISHTSTRCMDFVEIFNIILDLSITCFSHFSGCWASFMFIVITLSWNAITCFLESSWVWDRFLFFLRIAKVSDWFELFNAESHESLELLSCVLLQYQINLSYLMQKAIRVQSYFPAYCQSIRFISVISCRKLKEARVTFLGIAKAIRVQSYFPAYCYSIRLIWVISCRKPLESRVTFLHIATVSD